MVKKRKGKGKKELEDANVVMDTEEVDDSSKGAWESLPWDDPAHGGGQLVECEKDELEATEQGRKDEDDQSLMQTSSTPPWKRRYTPRDKWMKDDRRRRRTRVRPPPARSPSPRRNGKSKGKDDRNKATSSRTSTCSKKW